MVGAAVRKPRVPNDKLHRMTDNRLAYVDRKVLHGVCRWSRLARYGLAVYLRYLPLTQTICPSLRAQIRLFQSAHNIESK